MFWGEKMLSNKGILSNRKKSILYILCGLSVILIAYLPNFQKGIYTGFDLSFHLNRIDSLAEALRNGIFPVKIHATRAFGHGYGVGFFYCNFFLYVPAILINLGIDFLVAYKIFLFLAYIGIYFSMFYVVDKLTNNREIAFWVASFYLFSSKVMAAVYITGAAGEITAYIFMPLAIAGIYIYLLKKEYPYMLMIGFAGLILSHTISTFLALVVCAAIVILHCNRLLRSKTKILHLILAVVCVAGVTVGFWLPMFEQMMAQDLKVNYPWTVSQNHVETLASIVNGDYKIGKFVSVIFSLDMLGILGMIIAKKIEVIKKVSVFLIIAIVMTWLTTCGYFWHIMNDFFGIRFLQFPHRLFSCVTVLVLLAFAIIYKEVEIKNVVKNIFAFIILAYGIFISYETYSGFYLNVGYEEVNMVVEGKYPGLGGGEEWLPAETQLEELTDCTKVYDNEGNVITGEKSNGHNTFTFVADMSKEYYDVPCLWYKGFAAEDSQGEHCKIGKDPIRGMLRVYVPEQKEGEALVTVYYKGTTAQKVAYIGNMVGVIMMGAYLVLCKKDIIKIKDDKYSLK